MNEIKYRQPLISITGKFMGWKYWGYINGEFTAPDPVIFQDDIGESQEYTPLKAKNCTECYEGDILECIEMHDENIDYFSTKPPRYVIVWNDVGARWAFKACHSLNEISIIPLPYIGDLQLHWERIGNIMENPELLKEGK